MLRFGFLVCCIGGCQLVFPYDPPSKDWASVAAGDGGTCAIRNDGRLYCWGDNATDQIGAPLDDLQTSTPHGVDLAASWRSVAVGRNHACGIQTDDTLWCWGANNNGQLGIGDEVGSSIPRNVDGQWSAVSVGGTSSCAIDTRGALYCWGSNENGQLGDGTTVGHDLPLAVAAERSWISVSVSETFGCAIDRDGRRACWGSNRTDRLGLGPGADSQLTPTERRGEIDTWVAVTTGVRSACGVLRDGHIKCWGSNRVGELAIASDAATVDAPTAIASPYSDWTNVEINETFACARRAGGELSCWGDLEAALALPPSRSPIEIATAVRAVSVGRTHVCRIIGGDLACAGDNTVGQLADPTATIIAMPTKVLGNWKHIAAGGSSTCAIDDLNRVWCWGAGYSDQLANDTGYRRLEPTLTLAPTLGNDTSQITLATSHGCVYDDDGSTRHTWCWGSTPTSSLGNGTSNSSVPVLIDNTQQSVLTARSHTCFLRFFERLTCWGENYAGHLNSALSSVVDTPTEIINPLRTKWVAVGDSFTCRIDADNNQLSCGGRNDVGQVGDGTTTDVPRLSVIASAMQFRTVFAGPVHACAIAVDNSGWCWGSNVGGALGDNSQTNRSVPTPIIGNHQWTALALGTHHTCGIDQQDGLWCWGQNLRGQVGSLRRVEKAPLPITSDVGAWSEVAAGDQHTCGLVGTDLYCWGSNRDGQLGTRQNWRPEFVVIPHPPD